MSDWSTGPAPAQKPLSALAQSALGALGSQHAVLEAWKIADAALEKAKEHEARLREVVTELYFPSIQEGVNRTELPGGFKLKAQQSYRYDLSNKEGKTERAIEAMGEVSQKAGFIADTLVKWDPAISIKVYRELVATNADEDQRKVLAILQTSGILTITPGKPQLEIEPPKK